MTAIKLQPHHYHQTTANNKDMVADTEAMYDSYPWVNCSTTLDQTFEPHKGKVLRYCANSQTIPDHVPDKDIFPLGTEADFAAGYKYYASEGADSSGLRFIEHDQIHNRFEGLVAIVT